MTPRQENEAHIKRVRHLLYEVMQRVHRRAINHDNSKLHSPEAEVYERHIPKLKDMEYGSPEYRAAMKEPEFQQAIQHHYLVNDHHPEHFEGGINDMSLLQLTEMLVDWKAASERHATRDFARSLELNQVRFKIEPQLMRVLWNTASDLGFLEDDGGEANPDDGRGVVRTATNDSNAQVDSDAGQDHGRGSGGDAASGGDVPAGDGDEAGYSPGGDTGVRYVVGGVSIVHPGSKRGAGGS